MSLGNALRSAKIQRAHGQCCMDPPLHMYKKSSGKRPCYAACSPMLSCKPSTTARVDGTRPRGGGGAFGVSRKRREKSDDCHREQGPRSGFAQPSCAKGGPTSHCANNRIFGKHNASLTPMQPFLHVDLPLDK